MKASELIYELADVINRYGDCEVVVHDGMDPSELCHARRVEVNTYPITHFEIYGDIFFDPDKKPGVGPEDPLVGKIAKALMEHSPFLACIEHKPFPKNDTPPTPPVGPA